MSVLQVYLNWANSVLSDLGELPCEGVSSVQEGRVLCQLIDKLCTGTGLTNKVESSGNKTPHAYLRAALDHMRNHGIKFHFTPQDILDGDIKSILDVLWLIILNYGLHSIESSPYQRSVGIGKKLLLDWCQRELQVTFDPQSTLAYNLCTGDWFLKLLSKHSISINENIDREENLKRILAAVETTLGIKEDIISPTDITEGTVDEHNLMIYVSLLRLKVGDDVDVPLVSPADISYQSVKVKTPPPDDEPKEVPSIVLSEVQDPRPPTPEAAEQPDTPPKAGSTTDSPDRLWKQSPEGTGSETSDWLSQSSNSPISSLHDRNMDSKSENNHGAEFLIKDTISQHVEEVIRPSEEMKPHASKIPVRVKSVSEEQKAIAGAGPRTPERDVEGTPKTTKISVKVVRPRSPNSIMAEARIKQEQERERRKREKEENDRARKERETEEPVLTGSASETGGMSESESKVLGRNFVPEPEPVRSDEDEREKQPPVRPVSPTAAHVGLTNGDVKEGTPVFILPDGQKHDMSLLLEALRHARTEANIQDQKIQNGTSEPIEEFVGKDIEELEAQLQAVKAQSKELFEQRAKEEDTKATPTRGRMPVREPHGSRRGERRSPPRGILDVMVNQDIEAEETIPKYTSEVTQERPTRETPERHTPTSILRNRVEVRSPSEFQRPRSHDLLEDKIRGWSKSPERQPLPISPLVDGGRESGEEDQDPDKRLIKFLTKEIENLKLKMAILEKSRQRSPSPYGMGPRVVGGLPERERSPGQISSRARARFSDLESEGSVASFTPSRYRSPSFPEERASRHSPARSTSPGRLSSRSPARVDFSPARSRSPGRELSRSPAREMSRSPIRESSRSPIRASSRSPVSMYRSRTPERLSGERVSRPFTPRVLSVQDLSTSIMDDPDGKVIFSPASGAKPVDLGYSSPIRKVTQEIWGYGQTEDEYFSDTAKYEQWKRLISRDAVTDEDMLELKQALASCLVELDIVSAKLKNANSDIKEKMSKTSEVLNDCRAHLTKSQAENAELRSQNEKEKTRAEALEMRIKDMEENLHSAKNQQDDMTQELEESVITLKGIVGLDKNNLAKLGDENDKLRQRLADTQRENIKLKEAYEWVATDFNELKMYNDKAQTTIKDLKTCLEDARSERKQLVDEIKNLQNQGKNNHISSIVNHYIEKGLYEEPEKIMPRSRSPSPRRPIERQSRSRSVSPKRASRVATPVTTSTQVKPVTYFPRSDYTSSRSQTPTNFQNSYNYEDISPAADGHEIYPHRRTRSYLQKYGGQGEERMTPIDLDDPELQELLKPKTKLTYDIDLNESYPKLTKSEPYSGGQIFSAKRPLKYSPYMDKDFVPKAMHSGEFSESNVVRATPIRIQQDSFKSEDSFKESIIEDIDDNKFIEALDHAVRETAVQRAQRQFLEDINRTAVEADFDQRLSQAKGILKSNKSTQNSAIKENLPIRRSTESRSFSPSIRKPLDRSQSMNIQGQRSYSPGAGLHSPARPYVRSHSPGNQSSPSNRVSRSVSPGMSRSYSPGDRLHMARDSGYSTPTKVTTGRQRQMDNKNYSQPQRKFISKPSGKQLLSEDERRYADLLIDKYTRQNLIGVSLSSS